MHPLVKTIRSGAQPIETSNYPIRVNSSLISIELHSKLMLFVLDEAIHKKMHQIYQIFLVMVFPT